jgi:hypothetical protein
MIIVSYLLILLFIFIIKYYQKINIINMVSKKYNIFPYLNLAEFENAIGITGNIISCDNGFLAYNFVNNTPNVITCGISNTYTFSYLIYNKLFSEFKKQFSNYKLFKISININKQKLLHDYIVMRKHIIIKNDSIDNKSFYVLF